MKNIRPVAKIDTDALRKLIRMSGMKLAKIKNALGLTYCTLGGRLSGKSSFTVDEVKILCQILNIPSNVRDQIFFGD